MRRSGSDLVESEYCLAAFGSVGCRDDQIDHLLVGFAEPGERVENGTPILKLQDGMVRQPIDDGKRICLLRAVLRGQHPKALGEDHGVHVNLVAPCLDLLQKHASGGALLG